jgi:hypothetical protein
LPRRRKALVCSSCICDADGELRGTRVLISVPSLVEGNWPEPSYRVPSRSSSDESQVERHALPWRGDQPPVHHRPTPAHLPACGLDRYQNFQKPRQPVATSPSSHSSAAVSLQSTPYSYVDQATALWRNPRPTPRGLLLQEPNAHEASPVPRCYFLASLRTTNTSKQHEPRVLLSTLPRLHESPQPPGSRRGRGAAGRRVPSAQRPVLI